MTDIHTAIEAAIAEELRQVEAYRRILALHTNHEGFCEECPRVWPCDTVKALASIYEIEVD